MKTGLSSVTPRPFSHHWLLLWEALEIIPDAGIEAGHILRRVLHTLCYQLINFESKVIMCGLHSFVIIFCNYIIFSI